MGDMESTRLQILANAKYMICATAIRDTPPEPGSKLPALASVATLVSPNTSSTTEPSVNDPENIDVVIFGDGREFTAAVMSGISPAMEGGTSTTPEGALRKLLLATCELLNTIMPKVGPHQRNIHGGGVVDEDFLSRDLLDRKGI